MTTRATLPPTSHQPNAALVWIDDEHAVIVSEEPEGKDTVACLERELGESVNQFETRTVDQILDLERVVVSGPAFARISFERVYVAVTHRPDRLVEVEPVIFGDRLAGAATPG